jgi:hypothetical protein
MPGDLMSAVATALVAAALSALTTYVGLRSKIHRDLEAQYDKDLRERRMNAYSALWALSEPLALYSPPRKLSGHGARAMSERLRHWYFTDGIVLSGEARKAYFALQKALTTDLLAAAAADTAALDTPLVEPLQKLSRNLHTALSKDVASRRPPMIASDEEEE